MMNPQPIQMEAKPKSDQGSGSGSGSGSVEPKKQHRYVDVEIIYAPDGPPTTIDLDEIGFWDTTKYPFELDIGGNGFLIGVTALLSAPISLGRVADGEHKKHPELPPAECAICGKMATHAMEWCPYRKSVPHDAVLPPGVERFCICCGKTDGHPGQDWEGAADLMMCLDCYAIGQHRTGDPDCPAITGEQLEDSEEHDIFLGKSDEAALGESSSDDDGEQYDGDGIIFDGEGIISNEEGRRYDYGPMGMYSRPLVEKLVD